MSYELKFIKKLGIESPVKRNLSIALGTSGLSMLELTSAFAIFANGGERVKPVFIRKIVTMKGEVLEENFPYEEPGEIEEEDNEEGTESPSPSPRQRVISPQHAFLMTHLLQGAVQHGTGQRARVLGRPIAGKTGTSSDYGDAWFIGYTPSLLTSTWVGFDNKASLGQGETGARAALPIWISFTEKALRDAPIETFKAPQGVTLVKVNLETGLPAEGDGKDIILEAFADGDFPWGKEGKRENPSFGSISRETPPKDDGRGPDH